MKQEDLKKNLDKLIEKPSITTKILNILLILFFIFFLYLYFHSKSTKFQDTNELKKANDELVQKNKVLDSLNATYMKDLKTKDSSISILVTEDNNLKNKVSSIDTKIKSIKYEKATHYSDNFGSEQLKSYFADSLR